MAIFANFLAGKLTKSKSILLPIFTKKLANFAKLLAKITKKVWKIFQIFGSFSEVAVEKLPIFLAILLILELVLF